MKNLTNKKAIFWDFDGVILDSMPIRERGFREVLSAYPEEQVNILIDFHSKNAGLSRYIKFDYFFKEIRKEENTQKLQEDLINQFSEIMKELLVDRSLLNNKVLSFIRRNSLIPMHIVSGSDGSELRYLCKELQIANLFVSIEGSPIAKIVLVENLIEKYNYSKEELCLIGDSINDYDAASQNGIDFFGYNNTELIKLDSAYIYEF